MNQETRVTQDVIRYLLAASANAALYSPGHPQVARLGAQLYDALCATLEAVGELSLMVIENELIINGRPQEFSLFLSRCSQILKARGIEHVKILRGITRPEVESLIVSLSSLQGPEVEIASSEHLRFGHLEVRLGIAGGKGGAAGSPSSPMRSWSASPRFTAWSGAGRS